MTESAQQTLIVETAFGKFRRYGFRRVTLDELARELRISKKTLYKYFDSKEELVRACIETQVLAKVLPQVAAAWQLQGPIAERVVAFWQAISQIPSLVTKEMMAELRGDYPLLWRDIDSRRRQALQGLAQLIEEGQASGEVQPELNPEAVVRILLTVVENLLVPDVLVDAPFTPKEAIDTLMTLLLRGAFRAKPEESQS